MKDQFKIILMNKYQNYKNKKIYLLNFQRIKTFLKREMKNRGNKKVNKKRNKMINNKMIKMIKMIKQIILKKLMKNQIKWKLKMIF